jgi:hypothetical protein
MRRSFIPAPYAGTNRIRFNGFADCRHLRSIQDHPKVFAVNYRATPR